MEREMRISLLHATYRAGPAAVRVRADWLASATIPTRVEHVFALDADDEISVRATEGFLRVVSPPRPETVTAVRNWNAAADVATGHLLFVIADDLTPPVEWDSTLEELLDGLDPCRLAFAVRAADIDPRTDSRPTLLRHPIVSRRFFETLGLFDPAYTGLFCDDDITLRSFRQAVVLDGSALRLHHHRSESRSTLSQDRINTDQELARGRQIRNEKWGMVRVPSRSGFFRPPRIHFLAAPWAVIWRLQLRARSQADGPRRFARRLWVAAKVRVARARAGAREGGDQPTDKR